MADTQDDKDNLTSYNKGFGDGELGLDPSRRAGNAPSPDFYWTGWKDGQESVSNLPRELASVFNRFSAENVSGTPDFVLAEVALDAIKSFNENVHKRAQFRGESVEFNPGELAVAQDARSDIDKLLSRLVHQDNSAKEAYIRDILNVLGLEESDLKNFVFEEYDPEFEHKSDVLENTYGFRMISKFRLRPKTKEELAAEETAVVPVRATRFQPPEFKTVEMATAARDLLKDLFESFGTISCDDVNNVAGRSTAFVDYKWGWNSMDGFHIYETPEGKWILDFPAPKGL